MTGIQMITLPPPLTKMDRIAFYGPMCSGKSYMATQVQENFRHSKVGFADKLKDVAEDLFWIDRKNKDGYTRKLLQEFADDVKKWDEDIFIKHFLLKCEWQASVVCDDLRFVREAEILRANGFTIIKVVCHENIRQERIHSLYPTTQSESHSHKSEVEHTLIQPDYTVDSNSPKDVRALFNLFKEEISLTYGRN